MGRSRANVILKRIRVGIRVPLQLSHLLLRQLPQFFQSRIALFRQVRRVRPASLQL